MFDLQQLEHAHGVVGAAMPPTPALAWPLLSERLGADVIVKHENHTPIGAFKVRGGLVYVDRLKREQPGTIWNHLGDARQSRPESRLCREPLPPAGDDLRSPGQFGREKSQRCGRWAPTSSSMARIFRPRARKPIAAPRPRDFTSCRRFIRNLVLGVATYALELLRKAPDLDVLYVPIGQGSGICGCIMARDLLGLKTEIVGVQSTEAPSYALSFAAGTVVTTESSNTLADGMATRVPDPDALAIIRKGASRIVQVSDDEVAAAIRAYWTDTHNLAEGAGAAALAAALQDKPKLRGKRVGLILSGGNIDFDLFNRWVIPQAAVAGGKVLA